MFNVGDRIVNLGAIYPGQSGINKGKLGTITSVNLSASRPYIVTYDDGSKGYGWEDSYKLTENKKNNTMGNLVTKFKKLVQTEPLKTYSEVGITDDNGILTNEGFDMFIQYMFENNSGTFKADVADKLLAEKNKNK